MVGHISRHDGRVKTVIQGTSEAKRRRGRSRGKLMKHIIDDMGVDSYRNLKKKAE